MGGAGELEREGQLTGMREVTAQRQLTEQSDDSWQQADDWWKQPAKTLLRWLATFHFICLGWVFFRSETLSDAGSLLGQLFTSFLSPAPDINTVFVGVVIFALLAQMLSRQALANVQMLLSRLPVWVLAVGFGIWMLFVDQFGPEGVAPFIYFQF